MLPVLAGKRHGRFRRDSEFLAVVERGHRVSVSHAVRDLVLLDVNVEQRPVQAEREAQAAAPAG
jgi:hypothetical protein